jgi:hypothetical protein
MRDVPRAPLLREGRVGHPARPSLLSRRAAVLASGAVERLICGLHDNRERGSGHPAALFAVTQGAGAFG